MDTNGQNVTWATALTSSGGTLTKSGGSGTLTLSGANTYTGATTISAGIVNYQNSSAFATFSTITVISGAAAQVQGGITGGSLGMTISGAGVAAEQPEFLTM